jgi:hypothetical protein
MKHKVHHRRSSTVAPPVEVIGAGEVSTIQQHHAHDPHRVVLDPVHNPGPDASDHHASGGDSDHNSEPQLHSLHLQFSHGSYLIPSSVSTVFKKTNPLDS